MAFGKKPQPLGDVLKQVLNKIPHRTELKRGMVLHFWPEVVGQRIAEISQNLHFEGDKLIVEVTQPAWRHELHANRYSIASKLNKKVDGKIVKELIVRAG
ncbi:MAG: DUF721 domain-containing protein [Balneolaceae bacterium]